MSASNPDLAILHGPSALNDQISPESSSTAPARRRPLQKGDACTACNLRKIRCSGHRPVCEKCQKRARECVYPNDLRRSTRPYRDVQSSGTSSTYVTPFDTLGFAGLSTSDDSSSSSSVPFAQPLPAPLVPSSSLGTDYLAQLLNLNPFLPTINLDVQEDQPVPVQWDDVEFQWDVSGSSAASTIGTLDETQQQHLLWLYFSNQRLLGLEFYISRFYERLVHPDVDRRPHPSLLNAIYLVACKLSPIEQLRSMEETFYTKAKADLDASLSVGQPDTPGMYVDLARSSRMLAVWLWTQSREAEAVAMTSLCARFALACGLDQIPSAVFTPAMNILPQVRRSTPDVCGPPIDQIDLLERIYTFWSIFILDAVAAISSNVPSTLDLDTIKTPLPWSWSAVEVSLSLSSHAEERLEDLYHLTTTPPSDPELSTDLSYLLKALYLLHKACFIRKRFREAVTVEELDQVIKRFSGQLPGHLRAGSPAPNAQKTIDSGTATLQFIITSAQVFLHDTNSYSGTNELALYYARRFVGLIRLLGESNVGDLAIAVYSYWQNIARTLIRESKRLRRQGDELGATLVDADINVMMDHLREKWDKSALAMMLVERIEELRGGPISEVDEAETHTREDP